MGSTWLVRLCGQESRRAARLQGGSAALSWGAQGCREASLQAAVQHGALFLPCNWMHPTKECGWRSQGRREERWARDWAVLRSVSQQRPGLWGEGRSTSSLHLYMEKCCSHHSNHSSAATLAFSPGLEFHLLQLPGLSSGPGRCTGTMLTGTFIAEPRGSSPLHGLLAHSSSCSVPINCLKSSAKTPRLCPKREGGEEGAWRKGTCLLSGEGMQPLQSSAPPGQGSVAGSSLQASANLHSAALHRTHFSWGELH